MRSISGDRNLSTSTSTPLVRDNSVETGVGGGIIFLIPPSSLKIYVPNGRSSK